MVRISSQELTRNSATRLSSAENASDTKAKAVPMAGEAAQGTDACMSQAICWKAGPVQDHGRRIVRSARRSSFRIWDHVKQAPDRKTLLEHVGDGGLEFSK